MPERRLGLDHHRFRLPASPKPQPECWHCTEVRRVLRPMRLVDPTTRMAWTVLMCSVCLSELPRDPDPLTVDPAA